MKYQQIEPHRLHLHRERVGGSHIPTRGQLQSLVLPRTPAVADPQTVQLQHRLHLPPGSVGCNHSTLGL